MKRLARLAAAVVTACALSGPALAGGFGAIAFSATTGANSWAHDFPSRQGALNFVMNRCRQSAGDCRSFWFTNACGAVAIGYNGGWGTAWAGNGRQAQRNAVNNCSANDDGCHIIRWQCT